jgi:hypothetical protein
MSDFVTLELWPDGWMVHQLFNIAISTQGLFSVE